MADFVAVLKKTLDGLGETTPAMRERVYAKAHSTIAAKLRLMSPPPPAAIAERQMRALYDAIDKVEEGYARRSDSIDDPLTELENVFASLRDPQLDKSAPYIRAGTTSQGERIFEHVTPISEVTSRVRPWPLKKPPEPTISEGPHFELHGNKLAGSHSLPTAGEAGQQKRLHIQLQSAVAQAEPMLLKAENKFPELVGAYREYAKILDTDTEDLNLIAVWSVGSALLSFSEAYREQNINRTLSEPLEPQTAGILQNITRLHGAFVMGFEESRDLVLKSDEFLLDRDILDLVSEPGNALLNLFANDRRIIEESTLQQNKPVRDFVHEFGWSSSRVGYSAYMIVRNGVYSMIKLALRDEITVTNVASAAINAASAAAAVSVISGDPNAEFVRTALPIIHQNAASMLAFFNHSPEFRAYVEWALSLLENDSV